MIGKYLRTSLSRKQFIYTHISIINIQWVPTEVTLDIAFQVKDLTILLFPTKLFTDTLLYGFQGTKYLKFPELFSTRYHFLKSDPNILSYSINTICTIQNKYSS